VGSLREGRTPGDEIFDDFEENDLSDGFVKALPPQAGLGAQKLKRGGWV